MTSLACDNNKKKRSCDSSIGRDDAKRYKPTCREHINALFPSEQIPKGQIHYFFNPFFDDTNTTEGTNESEYWGIRGIKNAYEALVAQPGGVTADKIHLPFFASQDTYTKYQKKKSDTNNQSKLPINIDNDIFESDEDDGLLNMKNTENTAFPIDYRDWNMIINLLKYDGKPDGKDGNTSDEATDAEKYFFGPFQYACGDTLPGGYFDADSMRKEVTFVGLYFNNPDEKVKEDEEIDDCETDQLDRAKRYIKEMGIKSDKAGTSYLRGFIVVKDLSHKTHNYEDEVKVKKKEREGVEKYLYVEGLCSNARGIGRTLLNQVIEAGKKKPYEGTKLAALTVVISYYYKLGFRFYKKEEEITTEAGKETLIQKVNKYLDQFIDKTKTDYPSIAHFKKVKEAFGKDCDDNDIFTIEDYHYEGLKDILQLTEINAGASWGRRGKPRIRANNTKEIDGKTFKAYDDEAMGDMGYYMYLKDGKSIKPPCKKTNKGGGKNSKKRTKKKARRRKRKRTKRKRRRKKKRTKKGKRRRTKKRR